MIQQVQLVGDSGLCLTEGKKSVKTQEHFFSGIFSMLWDLSAFSADTLEIHFLCRGGDGASFLGAHDCPYSP